ncbi:hypothetical protein, partial [Escherichia coli]|uniref:hypothetical protein n=1 Tax=Escherichia coli TaxID=562 RepID=UPI001BC84A35
MASVEEHVILLSYLCHTGAGGVFYHGDFGHKNKGPQTRPLIQIWGLRANDVKNHAKEVIHC